MVTKRARQDRPRSRAVGTFLPGLAVLVSGCIASTGQGEPGNVGQRSQALTDMLTLNTFVSAYLEIDQVNESPPEDANLFAGADPADGVPGASVLKPGPGIGTYLDWNDLGGDLANHQLLDLNDPSGRDPTSFPRSNECVAGSHVLSKMDLVYIAVANNSEYGYFAVTRSNNNGDAGYYWLFTRQPPSLTPGAGPCKSSEARLTYNISGPDPSTGSSGDVLLVGHFHPSSDTPLLSVYQATASMAGVDAVSAINYTSGLWALNPAGVAAVAVNTTPTAPGALGAAGVDALTNGGDLEAELFAEAAVPISIFTGGSSCGASYYASVISRSSGSGGTSPDLKDLVGPVVINFGSVEAQAVLTKTCGQEVSFSASATGPNGQPLQGAECSWSFDTGATASGCEGSITLPTGARSATVTVSDPVSSCQDSVDTASIQVYSPPSVSASLSPTCSALFNYSAVGSGGSGNYSYAWSFTGAGSVSPSLSDQASGSVAVGMGNVPYSGHVVLTDTQSDIVCTASDSASTTPFAPLAVNLALTPLVDQCPDLASDAATYAALASGGNGNYSFQWSGVECSGSVCVVSGEGALCHEQSFHVSVSDTSGLCAAADSETETYSKVTTISASDN